MGRTASHRGLIDPYRKRLFITIPNHQIEAPSEAEIIGTGSHDHFLFTGALEIAKSIFSRIVAQERRLAIIIASTRAAELIFMSGDTVIRNMSNETETVLIFLVVNIFAETKKIAPKLSIAKLS
jgi:hypothetical protein